MCLLELALQMSFRETALDILVKVKFVLLVVGLTQNQRYIANLKHSVVP